MNQEIVKDASHLAAQAFMHTSCYEEIYRLRDDPTLFAERLESLFNKNIAMMAEQSPESLYYEYDKDENGKEIMVCFFMLIPSNISMTLWQKIRHGLLWLPFEIGWATFLRLLAAGDTFDAKNLKLLNGKEGLKLERMVVHPSFQGKGIGSRMLGKALKEVADKKGLPVVLSTQSPRNLPYYSRL